MLCTFFACSLTGFCSVPDRFFACSPTEIWFLSAVSTGFGRSFSKFYNTCAEPLLSM